MFETFSRSFTLLKESWSVLSKDREILLFPILSVASTVLLFVPLAIFLYFSFVGFTSGEAQLTKSQYDMFMYELYGLGALFLIGTTFLGLFFKAGIITCAHMRLNGKDPTFTDGVRNASRNFFKILQWAIVSVAVSVILSFIRGRMGMVGSIISYGVRIAWNFVTFLVMPILIFENLGIVDSLKKSGQLLKNTWGENIVGRLSLGLVTGLAVVVGVVIMLGSAILVFSVAPSTFGLVIWLSIVAVVIVSLFAFGLVMEALDGIFMAALYNYAITGKMPVAFSPELVKSAFKTKGEKVRTKQSEDEWSDLKGRYGGGLNTV